MKFKLAFALHNHQPVGNFNAVFEEAHQKCYLPFLELLKKYPAVKISLHQSGILWDWQKQYQTDFFNLVGEMVDAGQVELLSGGFYEPIMPAIPDRDKIGQLRMFNQYLLDHFEVTPQGMWLAERVWEPHLPRIIADCGLRYLPLDDTHFKYAGMKEEDLFGSYVTEEGGKAVTLLPILQKLRYLIPFGTPEKIIQYLGEAASKHPGGMAVYADDGEKFGIWPNTYNHCYRDKWLERFFDALQQNSDWLEIVSLGEAVENSQPLGRVYLPSASYAEMLHWALPVDGVIKYEEFEKKLKEYKLYDDYSHFVRGGHWRGFLTKYPESNLMHKKMIAASDLLAEAEQIENVDEEAITAARHALYAGQCNCAFWHGVFGGLYLPHLRWAIYRKVIQAEKILRTLLDRAVYAEFDDRDRDGVPEIQLGNTDLSLVIDTVGGQLTEVCGQGNLANVADILSRRKEGYHQKLILAGSGEENGDDDTVSIHDAVKTKEKDLDKILVHDHYLRRPLTDHFLNDDVTIEKFLMGDYNELGDFTDQQYESEFDENETAYFLTLSRRGHVWQGDFHCPLKLQKKIIFPKEGGAFSVEYTLYQDSLEIMPVNFGVEFDFNLLAPDAEDRFAVINGIRQKKNDRLKAVAESKQVSQLAYVDEYQKVGIVIDCDRNAKLWRSPIYTVSLSEGGFEKVFQGNCSLFQFNTSLSSGQEFSVKFDLFVGHVDKMPQIYKPESIPANKR